MTPGAPALRREGEVEVLVVAYGAPDLLGACLSALQGALPGAGGGQLLGPRRAVTVAGRHGAATTIRAPTWGSPEESTSGGPGWADRVPMCLLLNPDAEISPDGVARLATASTRRPGGPAWPRPRPIRAHGEPARVGWPFPTPSAPGPRPLGLGRLRHGPRFMIGSVLLINAEALAEVGPFDERFFLYAEETDWQLRATGASGGRAPCAPRWWPPMSGPGRAVATGRSGTSTSTPPPSAMCASTTGDWGWRVFRTGVMAGSLGSGPGARGRAVVASAAARLRLYRAGPCRAEAALAVTGS